MKSFLTPSKNEQSKEMKLSVSKRRLSAALTESNSVRVMRNRQKFETTNVESIKSDHSTESRGLEGTKAIKIIKDY